MSNRKTLKPEDWARIQYSFNVMMEAYVGNEMAARITFDPLYYNSHNVGYTSVNGIIRQILNTPVGGHIAFADYTKPFCDNSLLYFINKCEVIEQ